MAKEQFKLSKSQLSKAWKDAHSTKDEFQGGQGSVFEDGRYKVALTDADRGESKASGRDQVMFEFTFLDGDYEGKTKRDYNGLDRVESVPFLISKIESMGGEAPEDITDLEGCLKSLVKKRPILRIVLKTKNDYQNVYIDRVLKGEGDEETPEVPADVEEAPSSSRSKVSKEAPAEEPTPSDEDVSIEVGMLVRCMEEGEEVCRGEITAIDEENAEVTVKNEKTGKKQIFPAADLLLIEKEELKPAKKA